jgi:hypothetical protein
MEGKLTVKNLALVGNNAGKWYLHTKIQKLTNYFLDKISISYGSLREIKFGGFFIQFTAWFSLQMDVDMPLGL